MNLENQRKLSGLLSQVDIKRAIVDGHIRIYPYLPQNLTGIGYNLSTTDFFLSLRRGALLKIHEKGSERYVEIPPNDTLLTFTKEYIELDYSIAGTIHSKVSRACQGLGHTSTTIDPTWKGQLIFAINNTTNKWIKYNVQFSGNAATAIFHRLITPLPHNKKVHDNNQGRDDMLLEYFYAPPKWPHRLSRSYENLKTFIKESFTKSLNGEDGYIIEEDSGDSETYSFVSLKKRLMHDYRRFEENVYPLNPGGRYFPLISDEINLVRNCVLYKLYMETLGSGEENERDFNIDYFIEKGIHIGQIKENRAEVCKNIERLLQIIEYELESINHKRRINYQNKGINPFIGKIPFSKRFGFILQSAAIVFLLLVSVYLLAFRTDLTWFPTVASGIFPAWTAWIVYIIKSIKEQYSENT